VQDAHARLDGPTGQWEQPAAPESDTRERMLRDVLARLRGESALICTPEMATAHVRCFTELHRLAPITSVSAAQVVSHRQDGQTFTSITGVDALLAEAARSGRSLSEAGAPWAVPAAEAQKFNAMG